MAEQPQTPLVPTQSVTQFIMALNPTEFLITCGHTRMAVSMQNNETVGNPVIEWLITLALPPVASKLLHEALGQAIAKYEGEVGNIPTPAGMLKNASTEPPKKG